MLFVFGWGRNTKTDLGATLPMECPTCNNNRYWHLLRQRTWFTLFFVPVIPYSHRHFLLCPICTTGMQLYGHGIERAKELAAQTRRFHAGEISEQEYRQLVDESELCERSIA